MFVFHFIVFPKHVSPVSVKHTQKAKVDTERGTPTSPLALKAEADRKANTRSRDDEPAPPSPTPPHPNGHCGFYPAVVVALGETCAHVSEDVAWKEAGDGGHRSAAPGRILGPWDASSEVSAPPLPLQHSYITADITRPCQTVAMGNRDEGVHVHVDV